MDELNSKVEALFVTQTSIGEIFKRLSEEGYSKEDITQSLRYCENKYLHFGSNLLY